jgi:DnaJ-class molecular chaperone
MAPAHRNHYEVLGVARNATTEDVHRAYRMLARRYHPDVNAGADARARFDELSGAYEVLHDPEQRARYDRSSATAQGSDQAVSRRSTAFSPGRPTRDVPRFLDEDTVAAVAVSAAPRQRRPVLAWDAPRRARPGVRLVPRERLILPWWW